MKESPIRYSYNIDTLETLKKIKEQNYQIICLEKCLNSIPISKVDFYFPLCLIVGNEEFGLSKEILELADKIVHINIFGYKNSLNVSVATGIALHYITLIFKKLM